MPRHSEPLRIGIDARELITREITGIGRFLRNFLHSKTLRESGHDLVLYGNEETVFEEADGVGRHRRLTAPSRLCWDQFTLPRAAALDRLDVLFSPYDKAPLAAPCPVVMTFHDLLFLDVPSLGRGAALYNAAYLLQRRLMVRRAAAILTVSAHSRGDVITRLRVPGHRVSVTYNGVLPKFRQDIAEGEVTELLALLAIPPSYVLYVGNYKPHKNVHALLGAYAALPEPLRRRHPLVLAGYQGARREATEDRIRALGLAGTVHVVGIVDDDHLPALYAGAALFVFPSLKEGFGLPPLEAMASGVPVVVSNADSLPEVVGDAGLLVDAKEETKIRNAMEQLLTDAALRDACTRLGLERVKRFSTDQVAERILGGIESVARRPARA